jgi:hypothetical protein
LVNVQVRVANHIEDNDGIWICLEGCGERAGAEKPIPVFDAAAVEGAPEDLDLRLVMQVEERQPGDIYYEGVMGSDGDQLPFDTWTDVYAYGQQGGLPELDLPASLPLGKQMMPTYPVVDQPFVFERGQPIHIQTNSQDENNEPAKQNLVFHFLPFYVTRRNVS